MPIRVTHDTSGTRQPDTARLCHTSAMKRSRAIALLLPLLITAPAPTASAQDAAPTLHVYTSVIQVSTLVLSEDLKSIPAVKREQFAISLDHGPIFAPTHMRLQGDDPISLAILLDARGDQDDILKAFAKALSGLVPKYLHSADRVSIYAIDCALTQTADQVPADAAALKSAVASALALPGLHGTQPRGACGTTIRLWDAIAEITGTLAARPGPRVLLVVSKGADGKSAAGFAETTNLAESRSVTVFGLRYWPLVESSSIEITGGSLRAHVNSSADPTVTGSSGTDPDLFAQMCASSGGLALNLWNPELINRWTPDVTPTLERFITLLRGRYILEFPRPDKSTAGLHNIDVSVPHTHDFVAATGVTYASPSPALLADPTTIPSNPSPAEYGNRHPLQPKQ